MNDTFAVPANFTDAGRLFGLFEIRNMIEAIILGLPLTLLLFSVSPFGLTATIIMTLAVVVPVGGFALLGIGDDCLTRHISAWRRWRHRRGILTYRGGSA